MREDAITLGLLEGSGEPLPPATIVERLRLAAARSDHESLDILLDVLDSMLCSAARPELERASLLELLFALAEAHPNLCQSVSNCLYRLQPEAFPSPRAIGTKGLRALIVLFKQGREEAERADIPSIRRALQELRQDLLAGFGSRIGSRPYASWLMEICVTASERFGLAEEQYQSLIARAMILAQLDFSVDPMTTYREKLEQQSEFAQSLSERILTTFDLAAVCCEAAASLAQLRSFPPDKMWFALTMQADIARLGKRYAQAEAIYERMGQYAGDNRDLDAQTRHFHTKLLLEQRRWMDALEALLDMRRHLARQTDLTQEERHLYLDTFLHEARCGRWMGDLGSAAWLCAWVMHRYQEMKADEHLIEAATELAAIMILEGQLGEAEALITSLYPLADGTGLASSAVLTETLRQEAELRILQGRADLAETLLLRAISLPQPYAQNRPYEARAEDYWRLGLARLSQGDVGGAQESLQLLQSHGDSAICRAYAVRLRSAMETAQGKMAAALSTLQESHDLLDERIYDDLKVELCLEEHQRLLFVGYLEEADDVLSRAGRIATDARNPHLQERVKLARILTLQRTGETSEARPIYEELRIPSHCRKCEELGTIAHSHCQEAECVAWLGLALLDACAGKPEAARDTDQVKGHVLRIRDGRMRVSAIARMAGFHLSEGRLDEASELMELLEPRALAHVSLDTLLEVRMLRGRVAELQSQHEDAANHYRGAVHLLEAMLAAGIESGLGTGYLAGQERPFCALLQVLLRMQHTSEALLFAERAKGRLFLLQLHWQAARSGHADENVEKYLHVLHRLEILEQTQQHDRTPEVSQELESLEREREERRESIQEEVLVRSLHPEFGTPAQFFDQLVETLS